MDQLVVQRSKKALLSLQPDDPFWHSFTVFLLPFEKFCARRWYILGIAFVAVDFVTALATDLATGSQHHDIWRYFRTEYFQSSFFYSALLKDMSYNAYLVGIALTLGLFYYWQQGIPNFFHTLEQKSPVTDPQPGTEKSYQSYLAEYQRALLYGRGRVLTRPVVVSAVTFCSFIILAVYFVSSDIPLILKHENTITVLARGLWHVMYDFLFLVLEMWLVISFAWVMVTTGLYVERLVESFPPQIQLNHPDHCGGFKFVGNFALNMVLIILVLATLLAIDTIWRGYSIWSFGTCTILLLIVIASYGTFFAPIFTLHRSMLKKKDEYEGTVASRIAKIEEQINEALSKGDLSLLKTANEELVLVRTVFADTGRFSGWPFDGRIFIAFFSSQVVSIITIGSPIIGYLFTRVFSFLFGH
jgi:hypothetical protein